MVNVKEQKAIDYSNIKGFNEITQLILQYSPAGTTVQPLAAEQPATAASTASSSMEDKKKALLDLKDLLDAGILTQDEFDEQKKKILG